MSLAACSLHVAMHILTLESVFLTKCTACYKNLKILHSYHSVFVFCMDFKTNSEFCPIKELIIGFYNRDGVFTARCELGL